MKQYPLFRKENIPAYIAVMSVWLIVSISTAGILVFLTGSLSFWIALAWAAVTTMLGMSIMFVASIINLRKLVPGFRRLAEGDRSANSTCLVPRTYCCYECSDGFSIQG